MAYHSGTNPDALPAHAEPEQAAQLLSSRPPTGKFPGPSHPQPSRQRTGPPSGWPAAGTVSNNFGQPSPYQNKPPPPTPQYAPQISPAWQNRPPPGAGPNAYNNNNNPYNNGLNNNSNFHNPGSPPPQHHGFGPPPQINHGRPPPFSRPPPTPAPTGRSSSADASLFPLFKAVDKTGNGQLSENELSTALVNGDYSSFDAQTVRMMIRMFDTDKNGTIGFDEFCRLWGFLGSWRSLFDRFDEDQSGYISYAEYSKALIAFGYRLSPTFVTLLFRTYDKSGGDNMSFDLFVQSCIILKRMTDVFKRYDDDRDGYITLSFEEFLTEILRQR